MVFELFVKVQHDCVFLDFAQIFDGKKVSGYCNREFDVLQVPRIMDEDSLREDVLQYFPEATNIKITATGEDAVISHIIMDCTCDTVYKHDQSITGKIQRHGGIIDYPILYENDFEYHKIRCLNKKVLSGVLKELEQLPTLKIISINDLGDQGLFKAQMASVPEMLEELTLRQIEILLAAFEEGYYDIPRKVRTQDLAAKFEISRYGIEKSLRVAENKIVNAIVPYLYLKSQNMMLKVEMRK